jgi:hypothetical protein
MKYLIFLDNLGRSTVFTCDTIILSLYEQDVVNKIYDENAWYQTFSTMPTFTYIILGNMIMLFIVEMIVQNVKRRKQVKSPTQGGMIINRK